MKHALGIAALAGLLSLPCGPVLAQRESRIMETRGGLHSALGPDTTGGAVSVRIRKGVTLEAEGMGYDPRRTGRRISRQRIDADGAPTAVGMAGIVRLDLLSTEQARLHLGIGGGGIVADRSRHDPAIRQGATSRVELGTSLDLSEQVRFKASGRYQRLGEGSNRTGASVGAHVGLTISF